MHLLSWWIPCTVGTAILSYTGLHWIVVDLHVNKKFIVSSYSKGARVSFCVYEATLPWMAAIFMTGRSLKCPVLVSVTSKSSQGMRQNEFISHKAPAKTPHQWKNMSTDDRSNLQQFNECKQCGHSRWGSGLPKASPKRKFHYIFKYMCICTYRSVSNEERTFFLLFFL